MPRDYENSLRQLQNDLMTLARAEMTKDGSMYNIHFIINEVRHLERLKQQIAQRFFR